MQATVNEVSPHGVRSMLTCLAAFAASGQLQARLASSAAASSASQHQEPEQGSGPSDHPAAEPASSSLAAEALLDAGARSSAASSSSLPEQPPEELPMYAELSQPEHSAAASAASGPVTASVRLPLEPAVQAAASAAARQKWDLADVGEVLQLLAQLHAQELLPHEQASIVSTMVLAGAVEQLRLLQRKRQTTNLVGAAELGSSFSVRQCSLLQCVLAAHFADRARA